MPNETYSNIEATGQHMVSPIPFKAHKVKNMQAELFETIFENHYGADVRRLNELEIEIIKVSEASTLTIDCTTQRDRLSYATSISLHETFFNSIGDQSEEHCELNPSSLLGKAIMRDFGSIENCLSDLITLNDQALWLVLAWSENLGQLVNVSVADTALPVFGLKPILALNFHSYAYEEFYGKDKDQYALAYLQNVNWGRVGERFDQALRGHSRPGCHPREGGDSYSHTVDPRLRGDDRAPGDDRTRGDDRVGGNDNTEAVTVNQLKTMSEQPINAPLILDVRHQDDRERYQHRIMNTEWRDSFEVSSWSGDLPKDKPIVVYCMYGFWVSQDVATELRAQGYDARTLIGGINSWRAMGYESNDLDPTTL